LISGVGVRTASSVEVVPAGPPKATAMPFCKWLWTTHLAQSPESSSSITVQRFFTAGSFRYS
jgi:hypothetical protein